MDVKILSYTNVFELERRIEEFVDVFKYRLLGPITVGTNNNGKMVYVATLTKGDN